SLSMRFGRLEPVLLHQAAHHLGIGPNAPDGGVDPRGRGADAVAFVVHPGVAVHAPAGPPGVLDEPGVFAVVPAGDDDGVVDAVVVRLLVEHAALIGLHGGGGVDRGGDGAVRAELLLDLL